MAITFVGDAISNFPTTAQTSYTQSYPAGTAAGDLVIVSLARSTESLIVPAGWTALPTHAGVSGDLTDVIYRISGGETSVVISFSASTFVSAVASSWRGVSQTQPVYASAVTPNGVSSADGPSLTAIGRSPILVSSYRGVTPPSGTATAVSVPPGMTAGAVDSNTSTRFVQYAYQQVPAGATGIRTWATNCSRNAVYSLLLAIPNNPPSAPGTPTVTPNPVNTTGTIAWAAATDPESDPLTYDVELSTDNGATWRAIATSVGGTSTTYNFGPEPSTTAALVRVRAKDNGGLFGSYATSANFTIQHNQAPTAATNLTPSGNTSVNRAQPQRLSWLFNDPDPGDSQSKFDLDFRVGSGAFTRVTQTTTATFYDAPANTFPAGTVEWLVRTYDAQGVAAPFSASAFFVAADVPGVPIITSPANGATISTASSVLAWSAPTQEAYQVRTVADNAGAPDTAVVYTDSGTVVSSTARDAPLSFPVNGRTEHAQVRIRNAGLWSDWASVRLVISYTPPAAPTFTVRDDGSSLTVLVSQPAPASGQPAASFHDIYVRTSATSTTPDRYRPFTDAGMRVRTGLAPNGSWTDAAVASGVEYEYLVVTNGTNGTSTASAWTAAELGRYSLSPYGTAVYQ